MEQLDVYGEVIFRLIPILEIFIAGYCCYRFSKPFMNYSEKTYFVGLAYISTMLALYFMPPIIGHTIAYGIGVFAAFLVMCRLDHRNYRQKIFLSVTFFALREFTFAMAEILYDRLYNLLENTYYMRMHLKMWFSLYIGVCIVYLVLEFGFMAFGIWCISKSYENKYEKMSRKELYVLIIPSLMGMAGYEVIWYYRRFYIKRMGEAPLVYDILSLLYYAVAMGTIVVIIVLYQNIRASQKEKMQNELLAAQLENTKKHIEQVEDYYQNIRSLKHDMANHIVTLERLYNENQEKEAKAYGRELREAYSEAAGRINSGNPVADVILREAWEEARRRNIHLKLDFHYPADCNLNAFDLSVILNNGLQNALEYADKVETGKNKGAFVSVLSYRRNNAYMIEICNSFSGCLQWDQESGLPVTTKRSADGDIDAHGYGKTHGYGLANIRKVAEKYSGDIAVDVNNGEFCLSVMLMIEKNV